MIRKHSSNKGTVLSGRRGQHIISAVGPEFVIASQDILYFTGSLRSVHRGRDDGVLLGVMDGLQNVVDTFGLRPVTDETEQCVPDDVPQLTQ